MQVFAAERRLRAAVAELAAAPTGPLLAQRRSGGLWRAEVGRRWHSELRAAAATQPTWHELTLRGRFECAGWTWELEGRIDRLTVLPDGTWLVGEIKTTSHPLPCPAQRLREVAPEYFRQLGLYLWLLRQPSALLVPGDQPPLPPPPTGQLLGELLWVDIADGTQQRTPWQEPTDGPELTRHLTLLAELWGEQHRHRRDRLAMAANQPLRPFAEWRSGQVDSLAQLQAATAAPGPALLWQAPTGFGKTGVALALAWEKLARADVDRVVYLTGKATGQQSVTPLLGGGHPWRSLVLRPRAEHRLQSLAHTCDGRGKCRENDLACWNVAGLRPTTLFAEAESAAVSVGDALTLGVRSGVCPWTLSRTALPWADFWVGDYNYLFSPTSAVFVHTPGWDPARTLLLVDEAHQLPARAAEALSGTLTADDAARVAAELPLQGRPAADIAPWTALARLLRRLRPQRAEEEDEGGGERAATILPDETVDALRDALAGVYRRVLERGLPWDDLTDEAADAGSRTMALHENWQRPGLDFLPTCPSAGAFAYTCLDAAPWIVECLAPFRTALLMSATLEPAPDFAQSLGLSLATGEPREAMAAPASATFLEAGAPWRTGAYRVAIDLRPDTRLKARARYTALTAETLVLAVEDERERTPDPAAAPPPVVAFFGSHRHAATVADELASRAPWLRVARQPTGSTTATEQAQFLSDALATAQLLVLVLGGSFAEGIDALGGRVRTAVVVGPALPEMSTVAEARRQRHGAPATAFRAVYQIPALRRVHQALGRLVRAPGQTARVLLHCRRFAEPAYYDLLAAEYRTTHLLEAEDELRQWLALPYPQASETATPS